MWVQLFTSDRRRRCHCRHHHHHRRRRHTSSEYTKDKEGRCSARHSSLITHEQLHVLVGPTETPAQETKNRNNKKASRVPVSSHSRQRAKNTVARTIPTGHCFQSTKTKRKQESPPYDSCTVNFLPAYEQQGTKRADISVFTSTTIQPVYTPSKVS